MSDPATTTTTTATAARGCYAGIGSRHTPPPILAACEEIARALAQRGWRLRTGHAPGADQAFERGADTNADVFLPWHTFETTVPVQGQRHPEPSPEAYEIAREYHPNWAALTRGGRALQARNTHQILGPALEQPAAFAICWTRNGSLDGRAPGTGGTGQALRLCAAYNVAVFNLARPEHLARIRNGLNLPACGGE